MTSPEDLREIRRLGFRFIRWGIAWEAIEKKRGEYDWTEPDEFLAAVRKAGLSSIVIIGGGNALYSEQLELPDDPVVRERKAAAPPASGETLAAFQRFVAAAARRYAGENVTWEFWNEPDSKFFWPPTPDPEAYAQLLSTTCRTIKDAAPAALVIGPATAALPNRVPKFYAAMVRAGAATCLDGLSMHSYRMHEDPQPDPESVEADNRSSRAVLERLAPQWRTIPMLCTEWGYPTSDLSPAAQASYLARAFLANNASGIQATVWYEWKDSRDEEKNPESHFGLKTLAGTFKTTHDADLLRRLTSMRFLREVPSGDPELRIMQFEDGPARVLVAWLRTADSARTRTTRIGGKDVAVTSRPVIVPDPDTATPEAP
ncbi:MAG: cellulase family glycosylhydrolase [Alphaproteobacteria bacterium]|nr:cellulase family glycosylhydrolase [Alphaproteobacteria bacterium]